MAIIWNTPVINFGRSPNENYLRPKPTGTYISGHNTLLDEGAYGLLSGVDGEAQAWDHYGRMGLINTAGDPLAGDEVAFTLRLTTTPQLDDADDASERLYFPVSPEDIAIGHSMSYQAYDVIAAAQTVQIGQAALRTVSFSSFFPAVYDSSYCLGVNGKLDRSPQQSRDWLIDRMSSRTPLYLHFVPSPGNPQPLIPQAFECFISSFIPSYRAGHPLDVFFDIDLIEHRAPTVARAQWRSKNPNDVSKYKVAKRTTKPGETLHAFAMRMYGSEYGDGWRLIVAQNKRSGPPKHPTKYVGIPTPPKAKRDRATRPGDRLREGIVLVVPPYRET